MFCGIPPGPLLFNIFLCDLSYFLENTGITNHADDTYYRAVEIQECVTEKLRDPSTFLFKWFSNNYVKVNSAKSYPVMSGKQRVIA